MTRERQIQVEICHSIQGRLRLRSALLREAPGLSQSLQNRLNALPQIRTAVVRQSTGSVILLYDINQTGPDQLTGLVNRSLELVQADSRVDEGVARPGGHNPAGKGRNGFQGSSLRLYLANAVTLTGYVAYALTRKILFRAPVSQRAFSMTGLVAAAGAMPLFLRAWTDIRQQKRTGLFPFLAGACVLAIVLGEALTALEIIWILSVGLLLEEYATEQAGKAIREILEVAPAKALVLVNGVEKEVPTPRIQVGDTVVVRPHHKIPVDGAVLEGEALVDEATITGRAQPELHGPEDRVYAGTLVQQGVLHIRAEKLGEQTCLSGIIRLVEDSLSEQTEMEKKADVLAARLTRMAFIATVATFVLTRSLSRSFSVMLVLACPCATVLAASTAISAAIANAARRQIFIKGGRYLEAIPSIECFCFDKTGTITTDMPEVIEIIPHTPAQDPMTLLRIAATAEARSEHPVARALGNHAQRMGLSPMAVDHHEEIIGRGVKAESGPDIIRVGSSRFMASEGIAIDRPDTKTRHHLDAGHTVLYVAQNNGNQGMVALANTLRPGAEHLLEQLKEDGPLSFSLISGDTEPVVRSMAEALGFDEYEAALLPQEKARYIEGIQARDRRVLMIGDGVNDALALSRATVGVAMGAGGSEVAFEAADIVLVKDDLSGLVILRHLSRQAMRVIEQNFWMANFTNLFGIILGVFGRLPPVMAGLLHVAHTLGIMVNSGRLLNWQPTGAHEHFTEQRKESYLSNGASGKD